MKKTYISPDTLVVTLDCTDTILEGSIEIPIKNTDTTEPPETVDEIEDVW